MKPHRSLPLLSLFGLLFTIALIVESSGNDVAIQAGAYAQSAGESAATANALSLQLENFAVGLNRPVGFGDAGDMRLFVVEQAGTIRIVYPNGTVTTTPFLDIRGRVDDSGSEMGLLGLAFHPNYLQNGNFYVNYTTSLEGVRRTRISRFVVSADPNVADPASEEILLTVDQPYTNHNAGKIAFGPDSFLYIPLGDGGSSGDPMDNAQSNGTLLGKINRIDVDNGPGLASDCRGEGTGNYTVPGSNPFADGPGQDCDEIWANGLRNPWQSTFDSVTGDLFVADVGQSTIEEVNFQMASSSGGENYGWRCYEGSQTYNTDTCGPAGTYTFPIFEYTHVFTGADNCSITGGFIYRGSGFPDLYGHYFLTDYCSGRFWDLVQLPNGSWQSAVHNNIFPPGESPTSGNAAFGQRCDGELFLANVSQGKVYQLTGAASGADHTLPKTGMLLQADSWIYLPFIAYPLC